MSRAGKFIPGGGKAARTGTSGPIRAPEPAPDPATPGKKTFGKGLNKPVAKSQRLPIAIMSAIVCCLLVSAGWYILAYLPAQRQNEDLRRQIEARDKADRETKLAEEKAQREALASRAKERGTLAVNSNPAGASVTMGDFHGTTPASFTDIVPGDFTMVIRAEGYEDYKQDVTIAANKSLDLGTISLVQQVGNLSLTSQQNDVNYKVSGPNNYASEGRVPDKIEKLPVGDYTITASQSDWTLPPFTVTVRDGETSQKEIKFPFGKLSLTSVPSGATVREGHTILGQTPLTLSQLRPRDLHLSVDLPPYTIQRLDVHMIDFGIMSRQIVLHQDKDFISAGGIPMVWIPDGGFWAGKYEVRQGDFQTVAGYNPSTFRRPDRPVESVSWDAATAFCDKLNQYERKAGKLPEGFHYALPTETQWEALSADADLNQAATSRVGTLSSTQDAGASEPNKYGLYDTLGNVWEWCSDTYDDKGNHTLRGGCWLSSPENFPSAGMRNAAPPKYADRFIGFRVVLVPN